MKYATIGSSAITRQMIDGTREAGFAQLAGVYSRDLENARSFGARYGVSLIFDDLNELAKSDIEAVYVASPNALHYQQCKVLLECGKHVLCEKPLTVLPDQARELINLAHEKNVIFLEAIMMMHQPQRLLVRRLLSELGNIRTVHFDFSQLSSRYEAYCKGELPNIFNPELAAGCIMDLGVYCVYPALDFFGRPEHIKTNARLLRSGVDGYFSSTFFYPDKQVILTASKLGQGYCGSQIIGDRGTLTITMLHHLTGIMLHRQDGTLEEICGDIEKPILLANEMKDFSRYINDPLGTRDEYRYAQQLSVAVCETLQEMRAQAGLSF
ncbi:putative oxidoreductase YulF [Christensenellaceae bacterium]|nr:putative oxidoreductase YulF [Christensenellaceae bacterium]BDF60047.1 putative oxidoreductase YulF [Christensenellaceae bacterium]